MGVIRSRGLFGLVALQVLKAIVGGLGEAKEKAMVVEQIII